MKKFKPRRAFVGAFFALVLFLAATPAAQAAFDDPLFLMRPIYPPPEPGLPPPRIPPPSGELEGPCGIAVDEAGQVYVSDYYHHNIDLFSSTISAKYPYGYESQTGGISPIDGPCGLALDAAGNLYVNDFHRAVIAVGKGVIDGAPLNEAHPTGIAIDQVSERLYVNERTRIAVFDLVGNRLGEIGEDSLEDGYGLAVSRFGATAGDVYVADASDQTVKVYEPTPGVEGPVDVIDGSGLPSGHFTSLRDAALAIDNASGEIYVTDILQTQDAWRPEAVIRVFDATGAYEGRLKYSVVFGLPIGIAVDNSTNPGRVYVTTSNTSPGGIYAYPTGAATSAAVPLPEPLSILGSSSSLGAASPAPSAGASPVQLLAPTGLSEMSEAAAPVASPSRKHRRHMKRHRPNKHRHHSNKRANR